MDIAVKQEEAFEDGMEKGLKQGIEQKAIDTATNLLKMNIVSHEQIAEATGLPIEKINELAKAPSVFP